MINIKFKLNELGSSFRKIRKFSDAIKIIKEAGNVKEERYEELIRLFLGEIAKAGKMRRPLGSYLRKSLS
ncbi:hypothetical protein A3L04_09345 [Thermococcus chitonophagus]|uniref:Uncharacterized protein n=1 Tax=Thermococcus chitonophagus TaxID=54262 RepID=A0A160VSA3_9EURY|nr:hypothetical protein [Thermococcus chitonophagus]ASJ17255.1 hypothetical protein A3L04_09345 [Thermococcus chitonophagus]CUX77875.1 hypothetical protein CHITON_1096 [Thermococcus chitonophagus]